MRNDSIYMRTIFLVLLNFSILGSSYTQTIHGKVTDLATGMAISKVSIDIEEHEIHVQSDENGIFQLDARNFPEKFHLIVRAKNYDAIR